MPNTPYALYKHAVQYFDTTIPLTSEGTDNWCYRGQYNYLMQYLYICMCVLPYLQAINNDSRDTCYQGY